MVISNERLEGDKYGFVHMLRLTVLAPRFKILVESVVGVLFKSLEEAKAEIEKINNYDFDFIVFRHSREEGIWEPDTIVRLFSLYLRKFTIRSSKLNRDIVNVSDEVRSVTGIVPVSSMEPEHKHAKEIQQFENFETDDVVNELHLPIDLGDIFEKTDSSSKKSFILIAQPCDLMVRPNGLRHQDCKEGIVAEIRTVSDAEIANEPRKFFKLPYYRSKDDNESFVDLRSSHVVKYCILDLCVFQADGRARISIGEDCPRMIVAPWRNRYDLLRKIAEKTLKKHKELMVAGQKPEVLDLLIPPSSNSRLFRGRVTEPGKTLEYACRRTKRLSEVRAVALLGAYSVYLSRPAFERDIGQDL
jgi:hypothetical protein